MPPITPRAFEATGAAKSGFTISVAETKHGQYIRIGISESAQRTHFGGALDPEKDCLKLVLNNDRGANHVMSIELADLEDAAAFKLTGGIRGSASIKLSPWGPIANGKRPATELIVIGGRSPSTVQLKLPEWARPAVPKIGQGKSIMDD